MPTALDDHEALKTSRGPHVTQAPHDRHQKANVLENAANIVRP